MRPARLVTVVIPAFNAAAFLERTVASVLAQSVSDLELIIVDDGSIDQTASIARSISDPRVRVITRRNGGPSAARNAGWRASASRYVAFLDADDLWDTDKLERQIDYLNLHPDCVVVGCFMRYISSLGTRLGRAGQMVGPHEQELVAKGELFPFPLSTFLVRREVMDVAGGFDETLGLPSGGAEDIDFLARLAHAGRVGCVEAVLGSYRIHPASAMARDRLRINREARFIRRRLDARRRGSDLTWDAFVATERVTWRERRQDRVELYYRTAALWYGEGRMVKAIGFGVLAAIIDPRYTIRRLVLQRVGRRRPLVPTTGVSP